MAHATLIAIIDDDPSVLAAMDSLVRALGHDVRTYACAEDFLAAGDGDRFACVVCDLGLPGLGGLELEALLARRGGGPPVILVTGQRDAARRLAPRRVLAKPCTAEALVACLDALPPR